MKTLTLIFTLSALFAIVAQAKIKVATLSPLIADLARQVGGDKITVIDLIGTTGNPHSFQPTTKELKKAAGAQLYVASGKGMEPYLPKLKSLVGDSAIVLELGKNVRSIEISAKSGIYACCPNHIHGVIDPHWWQSIEGWRKATSTLADQLIKLDPGNKGHYKAMAKNYRAQLAQTHSWAKTQVAMVPKDARILATAHAAFGYFCKDYKFKSIPLRGANSEQASSPQYLAEAITTLQESKARAIFPDESSNPKALQTVSKASGVKLAPKIYSDSHASIIGMFQHNVTTITQALK